MPMHSASIIPTNSKEQIYILPSSVDTVLTATLTQNSLTKISIRMLQKESSFVDVDNIVNGDTLHSEWGGLCPI